MLDLLMHFVHVECVNRLPLIKRVQILSMFCEGSSMRSISSVADVSINTVTKLLVGAGETCLATHNELVRDVRASRVRCDEIWSFCYAKAKNVPAADAASAGAGDVWTWTGIDADTKLIVSYFVGDRFSQSAGAFMDDLTSRLANRVQLTTDGQNVYYNAVEDSFDADVDFAQLVKLYGLAPGASGAAGRYSPAECVDIKKEPKTGRPDPKHISTSYAERQNLTMRMSMRRFTCLTNAFSKKLDNHVHVLALYFASYNFCRIHKTLKVTPAMAAGITDTPWSLEDIAERIEARRPVPAKRGPYKIRVA